MMVEHLYLEDGSINPELLKRPIVIWGCGNDGCKLYQILKTQEAEIIAFCDSYPDKYNRRMFDLPIITCEDALKKESISLALAFHQWIDIIDNIEYETTCVMFADYLYEETVEDVECIICSSKECTGSKAYFAPFLVERMFCGEYKNTRLIHCRNCNFWFSQYRPDDFEMGKLYDGYRDNQYVRQRKKYEPDYSLQPYLQSSAVEKRKKRLNNFLKQYINGENIHKVLDYGGDQGQYIPDQFTCAERYVYEISGNQVKNGVTLLKNIEEVKKKKFDFIMCCQVLEHVSNPMEIIEIMKGSLEKNGFLYIEVPNQNYFKAYSDVEINEHINFFFKETIQYIAAKMNLKIVNEEDIEAGLLCRGLFINNY